MKLIYKYSYGNDTGIEGAQIKLYYNNNDEYTIEAEYKAYEDKFIPTIKVSSDKLISYETAIKMIYNDGNIDEYMITKKYTIVFISYCNPRPEDLFKEIYKK